MGERAVITPAFFALLLPGGSKNRVHKKTTLNLIPDHALVDQLTTSVHTKAYKQVINMTVIVWYMDM